MSWYLNYKKYKKQVKELLFYRSELEYQEEVLKEAHVEFEKYYCKYCADNRIDLDYLNKNNETTVQNIYDQSNAATKELVHKPRSKREKSVKVFDKVYREIAKEIHPDRLSSLLSLSELEEKEDMFKKATGAMDKEDWGVLLDIADKLNIKPKNFDGMAFEINKEIDKLKKLIENNEKMYSWVFFNCESQQDKDQVVKNFLFHLFGFVLDKKD
mgnify:CR=1 FL=1|tara:strand:- start:1014 stop:1652 length:639 start_codon:yes stop_codon:yes gene_type:complete